MVGRNDIGAFAQSHTGALATSWRTTRAALAQAGAVLVDDETSSVGRRHRAAGRRWPPQPRPGVGLVTGQAGPGLLILDALQRPASHCPRLTSNSQDSYATLLPPLTFQANPVDTGRPGPGFPEVVAAVAADPDIDLVAVYGLNEPDAIDLPSAAVALAPPQAHAACHRRRRARRRRRRTARNPRPAGFRH